MATRTRRLRAGAWAWTAFWLVVCVFLGALLACNLTLIVKSTLFPDRPPSVLGVTPMVVLSGSMSGEQEGHIEAGDLIFTGPADPEQLQPGDVITFLSGSGAVTHRILSVEESGDGGPVFITKGDANNAADEQPVTADQLVGVYLGRIPGAGSFALFLRQPLGLLLFAGVPALAFLGCDMARRRRQAARESARTRQLEAELARLRTGEGPANAACSEDGSHPLSGGCSTDREV